MRKKESKKTKELVFTDMEITTKTMSALIDRDVSDLFISEEVAKKLACHMEKSKEWLKIVIVEKVPTCRVARNASIWMR